MVTWTQKKKQRSIISNSRSAYASAQCIIPFVHSQLSKFCIIDEFKYRKNNPISMRFYACLITGCWCYPVKNIFANFSRQKKIFWGKNKRFKEIEISSGNRRRNILIKFNTHKSKTKMWNCITHRNFFPRFSLLTHEIIFNSLEVFQFLIRAFETTRDSNENKPRWISLLSKQSVSVIASRLKLFNF